MGLFLISFIMLVFGLIGVFGYLDDGAGAIFGGLFAAAPQMMLLVGILFAFVGWASWKNGNKFLMVIFAFLAFFGVLFARLTPGGEGYGMLFVVVAVFLLIFMIWTLLAKAGFMLAIILLSAALVFLFYGLFWMQDADVLYLLLLGVFGIIAFVISAYMAFNDVAELGLPVM